ncbi:MAG: radical SAM protein [Planctomycetes bacterium]|nr:radical SAM protein [Planctomycetota bacterium]
MDIPAVPPSTPPLGVVSWNVTRRCNQRCIHCYLPAGREEDSAGAELSSAELFRVADGIAEVNREALVILTGGEPLWRPDLYDLARRLADHGMTVVLGTNGVLLDEAVAARLAAAGVTGVGVSIDGPSAPVHDEFRRHPGGFAATLRGLEAARRAGLACLVQCTASRANLGQIPEIIELADRLGAQVFNLYLLVRTGRGRELDDLTPGENEELLRRLYEIAARRRAAVAGAAGAAAAPTPTDGEAAALRTAGPMLVNAKCAPHFRRIAWEADPAGAASRTFTGGCPAGQYYCRIDPEGDLTPCPFMPLAVGNLRQTRFGELWRDAPLLRALRERALGGRCGACEFARLCGGCRCKAFAATGDPLAEDPSCGYVPGAYGGRLIEPAAGANYMAPVAPELAWTAEARARIGRIPFFARGLVVAGVEKVARERGLATVTAALLDELRQRMAARMGRVFPGGPPPPP